MVRQTVPVFQMGTIQVTVLLPVANVNSHSHVPVRYMLSPVRLPIV